MGAHNKSESVIVTCTHNLRYFHRALLFQLTCNPSEFASGIQQTYQARRWFAISQTLCIENVAARTRDLQVSRCTFLVETGLSPKGPQRYNLNLAQVEGDVRV